MKGISRLKRAAAVFGVGALMVGGAVIGATSAQALTTVGSTPKVLLNPATGSASATGVGYSSDACPAGNQGSAVLRLFDPNSSTPTASGSFTNLSVVNPSVATAFTGTMNTTLSLVATAIFPDVAGSTAEIGIVCFSGPSATSPGNQPVVADFSFVHIDAAATTYTNDLTGPAQTVSVALTASPNPATVGQSVTLTAHVTPSNATGTIQFEDNGTNINGAVNLSGGVATTSFTPSAVNTAGEALTAVYNPTGGFAAGAPGTLSLPINAAAANSGQIPLAVVVPATGTFTLTVDTTDWVVLNVTDPSSPTQATASTTPVVVKDTRNTFPGWSVSGQSTPFSGTIPASPAGYPAFDPTTVAADHASQTIAADQLGWKPTGPATLPPGVALGGTVAPGTNPNGLGDAAQVLASVHSGTGNGFTGDSGLTLGADLTLAIPPGQEAGPYAGFLNVTSVSSLP